MMKKCLLAAICCLPLGAMAQKGFTIQGKIGTVNVPAKAYLTYHDHGNRMTDSVVLRKGTFQFTGRLSEPTRVSITLKHDTITRPESARADRITFYLENSKISLTAPDSVYHADISGSKTQEEADLLSVLQRPYKKSADSLVAVYNKLTPEERTDSAFVQSARVVMRRTQAGYDSVSRAFIVAHPNSYIALLTFEEIELAYNFNPDTAAARFARFPKALRESPTGQKLADIIETGLKTNIGRMATDFQQKDINGDLVKLSDFRGKYVLLDFWASWCKPCRAENPVMLAAYKKFKDKNFTILGVSLDDADTKNAWLAAVKQDGLPWTQTSELKGFKSEAAILYGVSAIPTNYLIDPSGKIIAKNIRGEQLDKTLTGLLGNP